MKKIFGFIGAVAVVLMSGVTAAMAAGFSDQVASYNSLIDGGSGMMERLIYFAALVAFAIAIFLFIKAYRNPNDPSAKPGTAWALIFVAVIGGMAPTVLGMGGRTVGGADTSFSTSGGFGGIK